MTNYQIHQTAMLMPHQPTKVMKATSVMEPSVIESTSVTICPEQVHQSQHNHGVVESTTIGGGTLDQERMPNEQVSAMSKRAGNMDNEQVSAKCKPIRSLCQLKRNDEPEAMKEDGRNEDYQSNPTWGENDATTSFAKRGETRRLVRRLPKQHSLGKPNAIYRFTTQR